MKARDMSQSAVSAQLAFSPVYFSMWLNDTNKKPTILVDAID